VSAKKESRKTQQSISFAGRPPGIQRQLRYSDLLERNIVRNRQTLKNWVDKEEFPPGRLAGPNCRLWGEQDVANWLNSRSSEPKPTPNPKGKRGRPRKDVVSHAMA
jgi:hypothetical protein